MSMLSIPHITELALFGGRAAILVVAFLTFAWAFRRWRKTASADTQRLFEQLDVTLFELRNVAERVQGLEARVNSIQMRMDQEGQRAPAPVAAIAPKGYDIAVRLAKNGLGVDELISNCGVARHEAELLVRLHGTVRAEARREVPIAQPAASFTAEAPRAQPPQVAQQQPAAPKPSIRRRGSLVSVVG